MFPPLVDRITAYVRGDRAESFEDLALEAARHQAARVSALEGLYRARGLDPGAVADWRDVPAVPTAAFKTVDLAVGDPIETFRSSGTQGERSVHRHAFPDLYRATIDETFAAACLPLGGAHRPPMLSLVPPRDVAPDSSLSFMVDHVLTRFGAEGSQFAAGPRGVELVKARSWLAGRQREHRPCVLLTTGFSLVELLDGLERIDLRFRLAPGSVIFETGGLKGRSREISRQELLEKTGVRLGVPATHVVREYGMTELTSQLYTRVLAGGDPDLLFAPAWVRVRTLDPESLRPSPPGDPGLVALFDLANLSSAVHVLTADLGRMEGDGLRLLGRAEGAELRGCSLLAEELAAATR